MATVIKEELFGICSKQIACRR